MSIDERARGLIIRLLQGVISEGDFYSSFPLRPGGGGELGRAMLARALEERDATGVEFGLYLGHRFGVTAEYLELLLDLADAAWHQRHEDVVDALAILRDPRSVDTLARTAMKTFPYRAYDEFDVLGVKCIRALGKVSTESAVRQLGALLDSGNPNLECQAEAQLQRMANGSSSEAVQLVARQVLAGRSPGF